MKDVYPVRASIGSNHRWYWRITAPNGKKLTTGAQGNGFGTRRGALNNFRRMQEVILNGLVVIE